MDYGKISAILRELWVSKDEIVSSNFLPQVFFDEFDDVLEMSNFINEGWVEPTEIGQNNLDLVWTTLSELRGIDKEVVPDNFYVWLEANN